MQSILHKRYKLRRSSLITSNRIIEDWHKFLGDAALTTAILDRLLHRSVLLEFRGKSYRLKRPPAGLPSYPSRVKIHTPVLAPGDFDLATGGGISSGRRGTPPVQTRAAVVSLIKRVTHYCPVR
ncbi:MAG: ATP-binding protein [Sterolibacteriaceae bacterium]|nr:ATP-binding protein [Sterolibacteriaceae bacterium]